MTFWIVRYRTALLLCAAALPLTGCGDDLSRTFGFSRDAPDEFQVTTRAPLSVPPDFELRPPRPGAERPQEQTQRRQAEEAISPDLALNGRRNTGGLTPGQEALLSQAGPSAPADIRAKIDTDSQLDRANRGLTDRLMFWKDAPPPGTAVDPAAEAKRLQTNAALGQGVTAGDTPIVQPSKRGWFDWLF
jgi:hypothetical protein